MAALTQSLQSLRSVGLENIQRDIPRYNRANTVVSYGLSAYVAMTLFLMTSTISTPITLAVVGTFTVFAKPSERAMVAPLMLSIAGRWVLGSTVAIALAGVAAIGMTIHNRGMSRIGAGAIAVTLLGATPLPIAAISLLLSGATLVTAFEKRASLARTIQPLEVFRERETLLPERGANGAVILGGQRQDSSLLSKLGSYLLNSYAPVTDVPYAAAFDGGPQLPPAAVEKLVEKANDRTEIDAARESVHETKKYALMSVAALIVGATIPTLAFVAIAATALAYEHYTMSLSFGSVAALRYMTGFDPTLLLVSGAAVGAYAGKGKEALPVVISAIASTLIFNASLGVLFSGVALSVPYIAYRITQQERSERYVNAAEALIRSNHPFIEKGRDGEYIYIPPQQQVVAQQAPRRGGFLNNLLGWMGFGQQQRQHQGEVFDL